MSSAIVVIENSILNMFTDITLPLLPVFTSFCFNYYDRMYTIIVKDFNYIYFNLIYRQTSSWFGICATTVAFFHILSNFLSKQPHTLLTITVLHIFHVKLLGLLYSDQHNFLWFLVLYHFQPGQDLLTWHLTGILDCCKLLYYLRYYCFVVYVINEVPF